MDKKKEYMELAKVIEADFHARQDAGILANLNKKNVDGLHATRDKILKDMREQLAEYQDESGKELSEEEKDFVIELIRKELWGYGIIDDLIHEATISDIKLYGPDGIRIKKTGKRDGTKLPSRANLLYGNAFLRNDEERRRNFLSKLSGGEVTINAGTLFPSDIVHKYYQANSMWRWRFELGDYDESLEGLWNALPDYVVGDSSTIVGKWL